MFHFPRFPLPALCVQAGTTRHDPCQVVLFGDPRIDACLAAPRGLSQPATSFFGFQRLGIHRVPFCTCRDDARARYRVLKDQPRTPTAPTPTPNRMQKRFTDRAPNGRQRRQNRHHPRRRIPQPSKLHSVPNTAPPTAREVITAKRSPQPATAGEQVE
jgi:hypothetical protein